MGDKLIIGLLILFIMVGIYAYDKYQLEKTGVSPVAQILDYAGISQYIRLKKDKIKVSTRSFSSDLSRLQARHQQIEEQRLEYIKNRQEILSQLVEINDHVEEEAKKYAQLINEEKKNYLERFPEVERLGQQLIKNAAETDPVRRRAKFITFKKDLLELLEKDFENPQRDIPKLPKLLMKADEIFSKEVDAPINNCTDAKKCLRKHIDEVEHALADIFTRTIENPEKDIGQIIKLTHRLDREYDLMIDNSEVTEDRFLKISEQYNSRFKALAVKLTKASDKDYQKLMKIYNDLWREQKILLDNLDLNRQRLYESHISINRDISPVFNRLRTVQNIDSDDLITEYNKLLMKRNDLLKQFESNEVSIRQQVDKFWQVNKNFFSGRTKLKPSAMVRDIKEKIAKAQNYKPPTSKQKATRPNSNVRAGRSNINPSSSDLKRPNTISRPSHQNYNRGSQVKEQMQKLRDRARDQGYYDRVPK